MGEPRVGGLGGGEGGVAEGERIGSTIIGDGKS